MSYSFHSGTILSEGFVALLEDRKRGDKPSTNVSDLTGYVAKLGNIAFLAPH